MKLKIALTDGVTAVHIGNYKTVDEFIKKIYIGNKFIVLTGDRDNSEIALNIDRIISVEKIDS